MRRFILCIFALCLLASVPHAMAYYVAVTSYSNDSDPSDNDNRDIPLPDGATWTPIFAGVKCASAAHAVWATTGTLPETLYFGSTGNDVGNEIQAFGAGTVQIGTGGQVAPASTTCYLIVFGDDGRGDIKVANYTGTGSDDFPLTGVGFQPGFLLIRHRTGGSTVSVWKGAGHIGTATSMIAGANLSTAIKAFTADGGTLGTHASVNTASVSFAYLAIKAISGANEGGTYVGENSVDDRLIPMFANPLFAIFKVTNTDAGACGRFGAVGDLSWVMANIAATTDQIQEYNASGTVVGTAPCVNDDGTNVYWWATKQPIYTRARGVPLLFP